MPDTISQYQGVIARLESAQSALRTAAEPGAATSEGRRSVDESALAPLANSLPPLEGGPVVPAFGDMLGDFLTQVKEAQQQGDSMVEALALGEPVDVHQVMLALNEARSAMNLTLQVRAHVLKAYQDLMQIPL